jgi:hypothetical protein
VRIEEIKERIDPAVIIGRYTKLRPAGGKLQAAYNPIREERTSSLFYYPDTGKWYDFGTGEGGDVIDFIERAEGVDRREALSLLSAMIGSDTTPRRAPVKRETPPPKPRDEEAIRLALEERAAEYLNAAPMRRLNGIRRELRKWAPMALEIDGREIRGVRIHPAYSKLFEAPDCFMPTEEKFARYLFGRVIGWDEYFQCPTVIIRDESERVTDIVRYRPKREGYTGLPKYLYTKNAQKPKVQPLFPLQAQMMRIMAKMKFCFVGEGLKNALNASMLGIPFLSVGSASNVRRELIDFLKSERMAGIDLVAAFDGDEAGKRGFEKLKAQLPRLENLWGFDSGEDFATYLKGLKWESGNV